MAQDNLKYPIDTQTFATIREEGYVYVDKTEYVYKMTHSNMRYVFLSRPRRFGKSLLISTLKSYFEGKKDLFKGLAIEKLETEWEKYPVLHFDMSGGRHMSEDKLDEYLADQLRDNETEFGLPSSNESVNIRLKNLIKTLYRKTGKKVVVLIDEYDAPLLDVVHEDENLTKLRQVMRNFYSPLKVCDPYLRFVFMTGITKFSQLSIFSELNNIKNISMLGDYAAVCGFTEEEMISRMPEGLDRIAEKMNFTREETIQSVKEMYDGYHFTWPSPDIYNPYSLLNAFSDGDLGSYWFESGTPTYLIEMLRKFEIKPYQIGEFTATADNFDAPTERMANIIPLLYQSGYITITGYNALSKLYTLDIPNTEVKEGLMKSLLVNYVPNPGEVNTLVGKMKEHIYLGRMNEALELLKTFLGTIPYTENANSHGHYQALLFVIFTLLGGKAELEERTLDGRIDVTLKAGGKIYVMELKFGKTARAAMRQIEEMDYAAKFALDNLPIVKVGISFSKEKRTISDWIIK